MAINKIVKNSITGDAIDATKIADDAISEEHLDNSVILGNTELAETAASGDILLIYDTSSGTIKKILSSNVGLSAPTFTAVSPTNVNTGDGTGNATFTITGTAFDASVTAKLRTTTGSDLAFDSVTRNSATQITGVIAISSLSNASEPYDVVVTNGTGLQVVATDQININAQPVFVTASGSLGQQTVGSAASYSVNATDPESAGNVTFELQSGSLPPSYAIVNTAAEGGTAIISGTDSSTSSTTTFNFVLRAVDAASNTTSRAFSIISRVPVSTAFTSSGTFAVPAGTSAVDALIVAGGGSGANQHGGGGGAGGLIFFPNYPVTASGTLTVTVGCGSTAMPTGSSVSPSPSYSGGDSVLGAPGDPGLGQGGVLTAKGGGHGGTYEAGSSESAKTLGKVGGSGGGGGTWPGDGPGQGSQGGAATQPTQPGNSGAYGFGNAGGKGYGPSFVTDYGGGGGGGAGAAGTAGRPSPTKGGPGGIGKAYTIADGTTSVYYAGGGGGGSHAAQGGCGGQGGGGQGNKLFEAQPGPAQAGTAGQANKGGGGGSSTSTPHPGLAGGKGVVIVRY